MFYGIAIERLTAAAAAPVAPMLDGAGRPESIPADHPAAMFSGISPGTNSMSVR
jgi:hypothetical protein